jgi:hypothetical protein
MQALSAGHAGEHAAPPSLASPAGASVASLVLPAFPSWASLPVAPAAASRASFGWPSDGEGELLLLPHATSSVAASAIPSVDFSWSPPRES